MNDDRLKTASSSFAWTASVLMAVLLVSSGCMPQCDEGGELIPATAEPSSLERGTPATVTVNLGAPLFLEPFDIASQGYMRLNLSRVHQGRTHRAFFSTPVSGPQTDPELSNVRILDASTLAFDVELPESWPDGSYELWVSRGAPTLCEQTDSLPMWLTVL